MTLEPITPALAVKLYLSDRESELATASLKTYQYQLEQFVSWCDTNDITNLNDLTGRKIHEYRVDCREERNLATKSIKSRMDTLRNFVRWLESIDGAPQDLNTKIRSPKINADQVARDELLNAQRATTVLNYLNKFDHASVKHVTMLLLWKTMMRTGSVHALDLDDYNRIEQYLEVRHRPDTETPLKNKANGERYVALSEQTCDVLDEYIEFRRVDTTDDYGREPLLTSQFGRLSKATIRTYSYEETRPCMTNNPCPHDRDPDDCHGATNQGASTCPSSVSPHAIRRGSITHALGQEVPTTAVGERANVTEPVLHQHYDRRSERKKMEQRRKYLHSL